MAYTRGNFGIEYNPARRNEDDRHLLRWTLLAAVALGAVSFITVHWRATYRKLNAIVPTPVTAPLPSDANISSVPVAPPPNAAKPQPPATRLTSPIISPATKAVQRWIATSTDRPTKERLLLERLLAAERDGNMQLARDTLERLRQRPAMADLDEPLARRLGALNIAWLFSNRPTPWTTTVVTRRGDSYHRIAREHGSTLAAVLALNNIADHTVKPNAGTYLRVMEFPRATLIVHRQTKQADVILNGKFFRRYYAMTSDETQTGSYAITREIGPRMRLKALGITFAPPDLDEIAMLLPPGASIVVANP